ncbi:helix-turn-helix domain-containing protein [Alcanivorax sp. DP30]|uniref:helix-turn-helix domain-containing protein n=1 Tax=Alcanivorax sp. DP30 TaxID=2606217 RepID=UPI00136BD0C8|nr:hypothetical protein [Alcanivorax sp. DP30]
MATTSLLTAAQRKGCQARINQPTPNGPRARALLALDRGLTQQQAAEEAGLSLGQVRYTLRRFRSVALDLFSATPSSPAKPAAQTVAPAARETEQNKKPDSSKKTGKNSQKKGKQNAKKSGKKSGKKARGLTPIKPGKKKKPDDKPDKKDGKKASGKKAGGKKKGKKNSKDSKKKKK